jgi:CBS domain-containing protein
VLLRRAQLGRDTVNDADGVVQMSVGYEDLEERVVSHRARRLVLGQEQLLLDRGHTTLTAPHVTPPTRGGSNSSQGEQKLDLRPYINTSAVSIQSTFSVYRTYILFRTLGLRHLTVVDELNRVVGLVTRKEMLGFALEMKLGE